MERGRAQTASLFLFSKGKVQGMDNSEPWAVPIARAGYTLLDELRRAGVDTPFIIYVGSNAQKHKDEAKRHGALGSANNPQELFQLVTAVLARRAS